MLIGLNGFKHAGKDTVASYLVKNHGFIRLAFADLLKLSVAALFDIPLAWIDEYKDDPHCWVAIGWKGEPESKFEGQPSKMWSPMTEMTLRDFLKRYGTESHRDVFGDDFWVEQLFKNHLRYKGDEWHRGSRYCVSDARFENELRFIRDLGGFNVRIIRPGLKADEHRSEQIPSPDLIFTSIDNSDDFHHLNEEVDVALTKIMYDESQHGWRDVGDM